MNHENEIMGVADQAHMHGQEGQPWLKMGDEEIHVLNPLYRLRNSKSNYVLVQNDQGLPLKQIRRAAAVVLALCNGRRTVADIARITRPLVKIADDAKAIETAKKTVKAIIFTLSRTKEERAGQPRKRSAIPAPTVLLAKVDYDRIFGRTKLVPAEYRARDFLPKDLSEVGPVTEPDVPPREAAPAILLWHFTEDCSTDCRYCYLGRRKIRPMPKERTLSLIEEAAASGIVVHPTGGDFLLYPHLEDVLTAMHTHKFLPITIFTKSFLSKERARVFAEAASVILDVQFSIDSTVGDVADYLVGAKDFCSRIFKSIDNALEAGLCVEAKAVITPYNILTIPKLYRDLKNRGVNRIRLGAYRRSGFHHSDDFFNHPASYQWLEEQARRLQQEFPDDFISDEIGAPQLESLSPEDRQEAWSKRRSCSAGRTVMTVCTDGKVVPCEQMPETEEYFCGDVSHQSIQEVWDSDRLRELTYAVPREKFKGQPCYDCEEREECVNQMGNCIRDLAIYYGSIYQPPPNCPKYNRSYVRIV